MIDQKIERTLYTSMANGLQFISDGIAQLIAPPKDMSLYHFNKNTGMITEYLGGARLGQETLDVVIPHEIEGIAVTSIGMGAFYNSGLQTITIPDSVTDIGAVAFAYNNLTSVDIPDAVTSIGYGAFMANTLTAVVIPESVNNIADSAFEDNNVTVVTIPDSVTRICYRSFLNNNLTDVILSQVSYDSLPSNAFDNDVMIRVYK